MENYIILAVNLGSTSTKIGIYRNDEEVQSETIRHPKEDLEKHHEISKQIQYRKSVLEQWIKDQDFSLDQFDCLSFRCGLIRPIEGGIYELNRAIVNEATSGKYGQHAVNLGMEIGYEWSQETNIPAIVLDGPTTNELSDLAKISGFRDKERRSVFHALNQKKTIRDHCHKHNLDPYQSNFVVAHLGGGVTVGAHQNLRTIDVTNGVDGEGPFSPERTGYLSHDILFELVEEYDHDLKRLKQDLYKYGGVYSYTNSNNLKELTTNPTEQTQLILDAMVYQIVKSIGSMASVLGGDLEAILITGGIAFNSEITNKIINKTQWIAPVYVYPGEDELQALAEGALRYLRHQEPAKRLDDEN